MSTPQAEPTPNPNSLKFTTTEGQFSDGGVQAYSSRDEAEDDPLARQLFSVSGVADLLVTPQFVTVSKEPSVDWGEVKPRIETILGDHLDGA